MIPLKIIDALNGDLPKNILELISLNEFFTLYISESVFAKYTLICINKQGNVCRIYHSDSLTNINNYYKNLSINQINQILNYL